MKHLFRNFLHKHRQVREHRALAWLGPAIHNPQLWHISRHGIALGLAIGLFFGLLFPVVQIPFAALAAIWLRANLPIAVLSTLITNPFTFGPIYYGAYLLGNWVLGDPATRSATQFEVIAHGTGGWLSSWTEQLAGFGLPLFLGLGILACTLPVAAYFIVNTLWRAHTLRAWRKRKARAAG